jgi:hypothetical protein
MRHRRLGVPIALIGLLLGLSLVAGVTRPDEARALESDEQQLLDLINAYRAENGLGALSPSPTLQTAAERHSEDMSTYGFFSHTTQASSYYPVGSGHAARVQAEGYPADAYTAENLAVDYATPEEVLVAWQSSPGHNAALLDGTYTAAGIGHVGPYWTLDMGSAGGAESPVPNDAAAAVTEQYEEPEQPATEEEPREPAGTEGQYEEQYAGQARYDAEDSGETPEEAASLEEAPASEEPSAVGDRYETREVTEADVDEAAGATPPEETPSEEAVERYVAEALAAEDQYDPSEVSGAESSDEDPGTIPTIGVGAPQPTVPQAEMVSEPAVGDETRAAEPVVEAAPVAPAEAEPPAGTEDRPPAEAPEPAESQEPLEEVREPEVQTATAAGEMPAEDAEPQEVRAPEERTAQEAVEVAAPEAAKDEASSPGERRANVSVFGITRLPDTGGQAEGAVVAPGGRGVEPAFVVLGALLMVVGVGLTVLGRLVGGR